MHPTNTMPRARLFMGKIIIAYLNNPPAEFAGGIAITNPRIEEHNGRTFVIGQVPYSPDDWTSGLRVGLAYEQVTHFLEFTDEDEFFEKTSTALAGRDADSFQ